MNTNKITDHSLLKAHGFMNTNEITDHSLLIMCLRYVPDVELWTLKLPCNGMIHVPFYFISVSH